MQYTQDVIVYTMNGPVPCVWCERVKELLDGHRVAYREIPVRSSRDLPEGCTTVPQVTVNHQLIGGYREVLEWVGGKAPTPNFAPKKSADYSDKYDGLWDGSEY